MKISASILSAPIESRIQILNELETLSIDMCHIDCSDDKDIFKTIKDIQAHTSIPIDLHIISPTPNWYLSQLDSNNISQACVQIEDTLEPLNFPDNSATKLGLAIHISNPDLIPIIKTYQEKIEWILLMTTTPGISGGIFSSQHLGIIQKVIRNFPNLKIQVDGGVNDEVNYALRILGVDSVVIGSYLLNHPNVGAAVLSLHKAAKESEIEVKHFMIPYDFLPIVQINKTSLKEILDTIQNFQLGMVFCMEGDRFVGIISNADIRKFLIKNDLDVHKPIYECVNTQPKYILETFSIKKMLEYIQLIDFPLLVLPVLDSNNQLKGAVSFHKLLKTK